MRSLHSLKGGFDGCKLIMTSKFHSILLVSIGSKHNTICGYSLNVVDSPEMPFKVEKKNKKKHFSRLI